MYMIKRKAVDQIMHSNDKVLKKLKREDETTESSSSQELYSNYNIKTILAHYFKGRVLDLDVDIITYDNNETQKAQWLKQQNRLIKKLKIDLNKFESKCLQEKIYIIGTKDCKNKITSAAIIRCFLQNENLQVNIIPAINYRYSSRSNLALSSDDVITEYLNRLPAKRTCGLLTKKAVVISQFIEILKIKMEGILDKVTNIEIQERINGMLQAKNSAEDYSSTHKEIVAQYPNCEHDLYDTEEHEEELTILDEVLNDLGREEEENIRLTVKSRKPSNKKVSWSSSVTENEMGSYRVRDKEVIDIFAKALRNWDVELFKEAKDKSVDFHGLVNYFDDRIKFEFWCHFHRNFACKLRILEETNLVKKILKQKEYNAFVNKVADGYNFLVNNMPEFLNKMQIEQDLTIRSLPEDRKQHEGVDFIKVIANDIRNNAVIADVIKFIKIGDILDSNSYSMDLKILVEQKYNNCNYAENLIAFITEKPLASKEAFILRHSILFEKHVLNNFKGNSKTNASINALLMSESITILSNIPVCERSQVTSMESSIKLSISGIHLLKDNKTATLIQHSHTQTAKLACHAQSILETGSVQMMEHMGFAMASVLITDEKLHAYMLHYLKTGEAFDSVRSAMENETISIVIQPSVVYE